MKKLLLILLLPIFLFSCVSNRVESREEVSIENQWFLQKIDGVEVEPGVELTFDENRYSGNGGGNTFFGEFSTEGSSISFGLSASTKMYVENDMGELVFPLLESIDTFRIEGDTLSLYSGEKELFTFIIQ